MTDRTCSIDGCETKVSGRGWCGKHYQRWRKHGDPMVVTEIHGDTPARFLSKCGPPDENGCIPWMGSRNAEGYGILALGRARGIGAHKYAYQLECGPVPDGLQLDHLCRNRGCVNPLHLEPVTCRENVLRGIGPAAQNAAKTHCIRGHEFDTANSYVTPDGRRQCRICREVRRLARLTHDGT